MCEFKVIRKNDDSQVGEDIVVLGYTEENELILRDILGSGDNLGSSLLLDVNTLNQTAQIIENPLVKPFITLLKKATAQGISIEDVEKFQAQLESFKKSL
ncbi:MAG: hypothetical protein GF383_04835 [Candidatus Lokiarchaeota archaeon]|nr:hypothetical protein [Candidatus Lokiarchaeota archaeon]MBD3339143.1 hypothetical protein [Candidatus Lokiarchaeota archaeon]